ncbi:MAG: ribonuclease T2 family protein [Methylobacter sp.]
MFRIKNIGKLVLALSLIYSCSAYADGQPGKFDYYLLTLSWSPEHCAQAKNDKLQCGSGARYGFVVHGLWPQYNKGYPASCSMTSVVPKTLVNQMISIMPRETLIQHEWEKHGTCSGVTADNYFGLIKATFNTIKIPAAFTNLAQPVKTSVADIRKQFLALNPNLQMAVACTNGGYLQEVRLCYDKQMRPRSCGSSVKDFCSSSSVFVRPVN